MNAFGLLVKKILIDKNCKQIDIAKKINMSPNGFNSLLNRDNISLDKMRLIADALNCDLKIELVPKDKVERL